MTSQTRTPLLALLCVLVAGCEVAPPPVAPVATPGQPVAAPVGEDLAPAPRPAGEGRVFVHMMVAFRTRDHAGTWSGWDYSNDTVRHNPDRLVAPGRRDIAAVHYPRIGPYDMTDPDLVACHCQMLKLAGLDGFFFDVPFYREEKKPWVTEAVALYVKMMKAYGLEAAVVYEDKAHWAWNPQARTRAEAVAGAYADLSAWLELLRPVQARWMGRPLLGLFSYEEQVVGKGLSRLSPDELRAWRARLPEEERPVLVSSWFKDAYRGALDGPMEWIWLDGEPLDGSPYSAWMDLSTARDVQEARREPERNRWLAEGVAELFIGGVWPGFDSVGCWGWAGAPQYADRAEGGLYRYQWERVLAAAPPFIQVVTWNDWFEGTEIEPSVEDGYRYLELTRDYAAKFKGVVPSQADLELAERIYKLRKARPGPEVLLALDRAAAAIAQGDFAAASTWVAGTAGAPFTNAP